MSDLPQDMYDGTEEELEQLDSLSNSVLDLIDLGRFEEAERVCDELQRRFPNQIDWIERRALVHEARGELEKARDCYLQCLEFIRRRPGGFDEESRASFSSLIEELEARMSGGRT